MSEMYEAAIAHYLVRGGQVFISHQYKVQWNGKKGEESEGGALPDFVALDFTSKEAKEVVVEVTTRSTWKPLSGKIFQRKKNWYRPIATKLLDAGAINKDWKIRFLGFLLSGHLEHIAPCFKHEADVSFSALETAMHDWEYGKDRDDYGLPGKETGINIGTIFDGASV